MWARILAVFLLPLLSESSSDNRVIYLRPDEPHVQDIQTPLLPMLYVYNSVQVFCKEATPPSMWNVFQSSRLRLEISACEDYKQYKANTIQEIYLAHHQVIEDFDGKPLGMRTNRLRIISLSVHDDAYYGIYTKNKFVLTLEEIPLDLERVAQFTVGLALWACCPLLADSLLFVYCSAAALGAHLAAVAVVLGAILAAGEEPSFARLSPLKTNFKQVFEERPTLVILTLLGGAWILQAGAKKVRFLWRYRSIRIIHRGLLRGVAYLLILNASDYRNFGRSCVGMLLLWPELWRLFNFLKSHYIRLRGEGDKRPRRGMPWHFARSSSNFQDPFAACDSNFDNRRLRRRHQDRQGCKDKDDN